MKEIALAKIETVESDRGLEENTRSDVAVVGIVCGNEDESLSLRFPAEVEDGICKVEGID